MKIFVGSVLFLILFSHLAYGEMVITTDKNCVVRMPKEKVESKIVLGSVGEASYDDIKGELSYKYNEIAGCGWRLVYGEGVVKGIFCVDGNTTTIWDMTTCKSKKDCFKKADDLKLPYDEEDYENEREDDCDCAAVVTP